METSASYITIYVQPNNIVPEGAGYKQELRELGS